MYGPRIRTQVSKGSSGSGRNWYTDPSLLLRRFKTYKQAKKSHRDFPFLFYYFLMTIFCTTQWSAASRFGSGKIIWFRTDFPRQKEKILPMSGSFQEQIEKILQKSGFSATDKENFTKVWIFSGTPAGFLYVIYIHIKGTRTGTIINGDFLLQFVLNSFYGKGLLLLVFTI